jgi:hypothetical protein
MKFLNRLWSDADGNTLLIGEDGYLYAQVGSEVQRAEDVWTIYRLSPDSANIDSTLEKSSTEPDRYNSYKKITYQSFADTPGPERRLLFINHSIPTSSDVANYIEMIQHSRRILVNIDLPLLDSGVGVKQFVFEFKTPEAATAAMDNLTSNTPPELKQTSLWYHNYEDEKQGLIVRSYVNKRDNTEILISPYKFDGESLEFPKYEECTIPFSLESLNRNSEVFQQEEDRLYRQGYVLQYFLLAPECICNMPWDSETDVIKRIITGLKYYGDSEAIEGLKKHRIKTRPYRMVALDDSDDKSLGSSRIGGDPAIPARYVENFIWPEVERNGVSYPYQFLMQIDFSELNNPRWNKNYPDSGLLLIFYFLSQSDIPEFARGYYFEQTDDLVRLKPRDANLKPYGSYYWEPQRFEFKTELLDQYPLREWGDPDGKYRILAKINEKVIQDYYENTYGVGAYSIDSRDFSSIGSEKPVFMQLPMYREELHILLDEEDFNEPTQNGVKLIGTETYWIGNYD